MEYAHQLIEANQAAQAAVLRSRESAAYSLDKGAKCSTSEAGEHWAEYGADFRELKKDETKAGKYLVIKQDTWRDVWRANLITETKTSIKPPEQKGDRWTEKLSAKAARKIDESARYWAQEGGGFQTFLTLTFQPKERDLLRAWDEIQPRYFSPEPGNEIKNDWKKTGAYGMESQALHGPVIPERKTIGRLVTQFLNVLQMGKKRGKKFKDFEIEPAGKFSFIWVIENPKTRRVIHTEHGPDFFEFNNPHVHVLLDWGVPFKQFKEWAAWIESTWGKGYAKLEKLKKPKSAAAYMAKAAGYIRKGANGEQGRVRGNRYSISKEARAPKPQILGIYQACKTIYGIVKEMAEYQRENAWKVRERKARIKANQATPEDIAKEKAGRVWFSPWGFGSNDVDTWAKVWAGLVDAGWRPEQAAPNWDKSRWINRMVDNFKTKSQRAKAWADDYWLAVQDQYQQAAAMIEFYNSQNQEAFICH